MPDRSVDLEGFFEAALGLIVVLADAVHFTQGPDRVRLPTAMGYPAVQVQRLQIQVGRRVVMGDHELHVAKAFGAAGLASKVEYLLRDGKSCVVELLRFFIPALHPRHVSETLDAV